MHSNLLIPHVFSLTATSSHSNPYTHRQLVGWCYQHQISSSRLNQTDLLLQRDGWFFTCYTDHRPLRRVKHRGLALPLPPLVFGEVPWQRVSGQPHRGRRRAWGQRPPRPLAPEGRLAEAGALAEGVVVGRLHPASEAGRRRGQEDVRISGGRDGWMEGGEVEQRGERARKRRSKGWEEGEEEEREAEFEKSTSCIIHSRHAERSRSVYEAEQQHEGDQRHK